MADVETALVKVTGSRPHARGRPGVSAVCMSRQWDIAWQEAQWWLR